MLAAMASRERTRTQWAELLESVGLEIETIRTYAPSVDESTSIMTVVHKADY